MSAFNYRISRVIDVVHAAGGVAVLAHPIVISSPTGGWITERDLAQLVKFGLTVSKSSILSWPGVPRDYFLRLAQHFDLAISGGSDEHGQPASCRRLGQQPVTEEIVSGLLARRRA